MKPWKTVARRTLLDSGRFLTVEEHTIELPDGRLLANWPWLITPDYINVVALTKEGRLVCLRQTKYAVPGVSLAIVGGYIEPGEDALAAAKRELLEETGYQAPDWTYFGPFPVDGNRGAGVAHPFIAQGAHRVADTCADDLEEQEIVLISPDQAEAALMSGEFKLLPWAMTMAMALLSLKAKH